ncbi:hypothetical protein IT398_01150 [Candidatus Nomurabacteria bacterium]|nr:hypothetical protein [Candidatus Nomurabacteria bacterium]
MKGLGIFLIKFRGILPANQLVKQAVQDVLHRLIGVEVGLEMIKVEKRSLYLMVSPVVKNLVFLKREQIAAEIAKLLGELKERVVL